MPTMIKAIARCDTNLCTEELEFEATLTTGFMSGHTEIHDRDILEDADYGDEEYTTETWEVSWGADETQKRILHAILHDGEPYPEETK